MTILPSDKKDVPVTVTLKAETVFAILLAACHLPAVSPEEFETLGNAFSEALKL